MGGKGVGGECCQQSGKCNWRMGISEQVYASDPIRMNHRDTETPERQHCPRNTLNTRRKTVGLESNLCLPAITSDVGLAKSEGLAAAGDFVVKILFE